MSSKSLFGVTNIINIDDLADFVLQECLKNPDGKIQAKEIQNAKNPNNDTINLLRDKLSPYGKFETGFGDLNWSSFQLIEYDFARKGGFKGRRDEIERENILRELTCVNLRAATSYYKSAKCLAAWSLAISIIAIVSTIISIVIARM